MGAKMNSATGSVKCEYANGSCAQKSLRADDFPVRAGNSFPWLKIHSVRPFFHSMRRNSICAGRMPFRASQLSIRADKFDCAAIFQFWAGCFNLVRRKPLIFSIFCSRGVTNDSSPR